MKPNKKTFTEIANAFNACGLEALRPVYDYLEEKYDYEILKIVRVVLMNEE